MMYSEQVKKENLKRIAEDEKIKDISEDTGISIPTLYNWKNSEEYIKFQKVKQASKKVRELIEQGKSKEAESICRKEEFKDNKVIQSQRVNILIKKEIKRV